MSYPDAIAYLYGLQKHGIKLGLSTIRTIASLLGDPQKSFRSIHVAGTNGKGSVCAMTASILRAHGFRVGLFTSPHLVSFTERIRINDEQIPEAEVVRLTDEIRRVISPAAVDVSSPTFFEVATAMAFLHFQRGGIDWAVVEVGMGGRLDSTNIILPEASVISRISYDHQAFLGGSLNEIAAEKAGIIKDGVPVVSARQEGVAWEVIESAARQHAAPLALFGRDFNGVMKHSGLSGITFDYRDGLINLEGLAVPLAGDHQLFNACLAVRAVTTALTRAGSGGPRPEFIRQGLVNVRWPGRLELIDDEPPLLLDGAHNPDAASRLAAFVNTYITDRRIVLIMGVMADKDVQGILEPLLPVAAEIIFTAPEYERAARPEDLSGIASSLGFPSHVTRSVRDAIQLARDLTRVSGAGPALILITGSFFTIGEAKQVLGEKPVLGTLREKL